ncbi:MAG: ABC transporter ATP-binding protein [Gammaproteobacteria bacterium]|nr:ABC transporter ATP-binding protein [Gammaproteobacteria bacterium]
MSTSPLLKIENLRTYFYSRAKQAFIRSVDGVDLEVNKGDTLGIVGESGSGKSVTMLSIMGLIAARPGIISGEVWYQGEKRINLLDGLKDHLNVTEENGRVMGIEKEDAQWQRRLEANMEGIRGKEIAMIFQNPKSAMNPFFTIGHQIVENIIKHTPYKAREEAKDRALYWLDRVKIDSPKLRFFNHPYGLSGGMCQRAMIAMALSSEAKLLIADEPTTGLDATIQSRIADLLEELREQTGVTIVIISHDMGVIGRLSNKIAVMYGGRVMESGPSAAVIDHSDGKSHPYTEALLKSIPKEDNLSTQGHLNSIDGEVLDTINVPKGCRFATRCQRINKSIEERCKSEEPPLADVSTGHKIRCWLYAD